MRRKSRSIVLYLVLVLLANGVKAQEEKYIGLFIYNFTKYFDWPEGAKTGDFIIEIIGHESVGSELNKLTTGKKLGSQNIVVKNIGKVEEMSGHAHIVFVGHWQSRFISDVLPKIQNKHVLLISEMEGMLDKGSAINFIIREGTIKFELDISNVTTYRLKADQRIRELAYRVVE
jgi:hypothetical protein